MASNDIHLNGLDFSLFISDHEISEMVSRVANEINVDYEKRFPLFIVMLNGAFIFAADLLREITVPSDITMARTKSYQGTRSSGVVQLLLEPDIEIENREVVIIEDILDTGNTLHYFMDYLDKKNPKSIEVVSLLSKPDAHKYQIDIKYLGKKIPNDFVIGYGLDFDGQARNLPHIYKKI